MLAKLTLRIDRFYVPVLIKRAEKKQGGGGQGGLRPAGALRPGKGAVPSGGGADRTRPAPAWPGIL